MVRSGDTGHLNDLIIDSMLYKSRNINPCMVDVIVLFNKTQVLEYKSQLTFLFLAAVNHLSKPLRKQDSTSDKFKSPWLMICDWWISTHFVCFCVSWPIAWDHDND